MRCPLCGLKLSDRINTGIDLVDASFYAIGIYTCKCGYIRTVQETPEDRWRKFLSINNKLEGKS